MTAIPKKKTKGRLRIPIKRIEHKTKRSVAFSKRRTNLFKKAAELCTLCGSQVAIVTFSEAGKAFTFGHPDTNSVIQRFLHGSSSLLSPDLPSQRSDPSTSLNHSVAQTSNPNGQFWWENSIDNMRLEELQHYSKSLESLMNNAAARAASMSTFSPSFAPNMAGSSNQNVSGVEFKEGYVDKMGLEELQQSTEFPKHDVAASATTSVSPCSPLFAPNMAGLSNKNVCGVEFKESYVDKMGLEELQQQYTKSLESLEHDRAASTTTFNPVCSTSFAPDMAGSYFDDMKSEQDGMDLFANMEAWFADAGYFV